MKGQTHNLDPELTDLLTLLEVHMGFELTITSGHRDIAHNLAVGGVTNSEHTYLPAQGADVLCKQSVTRHKMLKWLYVHDVRRIGIGKDFIHVGISEELPQYVSWVYYKDTAEPETPKAVLA
jgi:uncharacterized protein YcbK (DUF882 family)